MEKRLIVVLGCLLLAVGIRTAAAEEKVPSFKHPAPGFTTYGDIRLRQIYGNQWYLNNDIKDGHHNFGRYRLRIGELIQVDEDITVDGRLTWEFRSWNDPDGYGKDSHVDGDEAIIDRLNVKIENLFDAPLTGTFGRQDIILSPWLILDGTPFDGSRTIFFDAARLTFNFDESATTVDMVYVDNRASANDRLKPIGDEDLYLTEQDEIGAILYLKNKSIPDTQLEGYFIYKNDNPIDDSPAHMITKNMPARWSKKAEVFTFGGAVAGNMDENWSYRVEGAIQTGDKDHDNDGRTTSMRAWGTNNSLAYNFNDEKKSQLRLEYEYLSGDDTSTDGRVEAFDPLWGEWPRFSELYIYTYAMETMIGEVTNLHRAGLFYDVSPVKKMLLKTGYNLMWADETRTGGPGGNYFGGDSFRGQLFTARLMYQFTKSLSGRIDAEYLIPGDFYADENQNEAVFLRGQIVYSF
jgi:hypothetical protein